MPILNKLIGKAYLERQFRRFHKLFMRAKILDPLRDAVDNKVDPIEGYGLSKNDLTDELHDKLVDLHNYDDTGIKRDIRINTYNLNVLKSDVNTPGSALNTVNTSVENVLDGAPEDFDTLKEISDWIDAHEPPAAAMYANVQQNTENLDSLKEQWDNYVVLENESDDIDFENSANFYVSDWIRVVPRSLKFIGSGLLTDNPSDYTVDLIQSRVTYDGTIYSSEPLTVSLDNLELLDLSVSIRYNKSVKSVIVDISGTCAASTTYTTGKIDNVTFELHQWLRLSSDSEFDPSNVVVNNVTGYRDYYDCTVSKVVLTVETDAEGHTQDKTSGNVYTLSELLNFGLDVDVDVEFGVLHNGNFDIQSTITVKGRSVCSSDAYVDSEQSKEFVVYDTAYYTPTSSDLGSISKANAIKWVSES